MQNKAIFRLSGGFYINMDKDIRLRNKSLKIGFKIGVFGYME